MMARISGAERNRRGPQAKTDSNSRELFTVAPRSLLFVIAFFLWDIFGRFQFRFPSSDHD